MVLEQRNNYTSFPMSAFVRRGERSIPLSAVIIGGMIHAFSGQDKFGAEKECTASYERFKKTFAFSDATIYRSIRILKNQKYISTTRQSTYVFDTSKRRRSFYRLDNLFFTQSFNVDGQQQRLTNAQILVLSYIVTNVKRYKKNNDDFKCSERDIMRALGIDIKTVHTAIHVLMKADLIYRKRGVNAHAKSTFDINSKIFRDKAKSERPAPTVKSKIDVESYYSDIRAKAEEKAEQNRQRAERYLPFAKADKTYRSLAIKSAYDVTLEHDFELAKRDRLVALSQIGLSEGDLEPIYKCKACEDTGYHKSDGKRCACWPQWL